MAWPMTYSASSNTRMKPARDTGRAGPSASTVMAAASSHGFLRSASNSPSLKSFIRCECNLLRDTIIQRIFCDNSPTVGRSGDQDWLRFMARPGILCLSAPLLKTPNIFLMRSMITVLISAARGRVCGPHSPVSARRAVSSRAQTSTRFTACW